MGKLNAVCEKLMSTHDFISFSALKKLKKSTVRTIDELPIERKGETLHSTFVGDGSLYKVARIIMGTLLEIGTGVMSTETIDEIFESKVRQHAEETVSA